MNELYQQRVNRDIRARYTTGFGNSDYQTHFAVLYEVSWL